MALLQPEAHFDAQELRTALKVPGQEARQVTWEVRMVLRDRAGRGTRRRPRQRPLSHPILTLRRPHCPQLLSATLMAWPDLSTLSRFIAGLRSCQRGDRGNSRYPRSTPAARVPGGLQTGSERRVGPQGLEGNPRGSRLLPCRLPRPALWEPGCPRSVPWGSLLPPPPPGPSSPQSPQGRRPDVIIKEGEATISHLCQGLQGRFRGNDNWGSVAVPRVPMSSSQPLADASRAEWNLAAAGGRGGDPLPESRVSPARPLAGGRVWPSHPSPTSLVGRDQLFLILVLAPPPLSCSSPCPRRAVLTPLLPLSLLGSVLLSLPCSRPLVASCLLHDSSSPPVTAGPWPSRLTLWVSLSPLHCPE